MEHSEANIDASKADHEEDSRMFVPVAHGIEL